METQRAPLRVKALQTDRGTEYLNSTVWGFCAERGIQHDKSAPYTPQQNGAAERLNRTLQDSARAMLASCGLDPKYWRLALEAANAIRNRSPVRGRAQTPHELFWGVRPDVSHMRVFGCKAFVPKPMHARRHKLDAVADEGRFVGWEPDGNYRFLVNGSLVVRRDAVFDEAAPEPAAVIPTAADESDSDSDADDCRPAQAAGPVGAPGGQSAGEQAGAGEAQLQGAGDLPGAAAEGTAQTGEQRRYPARERKEPDRYKPHAAAAAASADPEWPHPSAADPTWAGGDEPTQEQAATRPDWHLWLAAMRDEMESLQSLSVYTLAEPPPGSKSLGVRWVLKVKRDAEGRVARYKARLVVKGFQQRPGVDFDETFAPTGRLASLRALLALVAARDLELHQLDVKTAFLYGELEPGTEVYCDLPPGVPLGGPPLKMRLRRALYGLRQAPRAWYAKLKGVLEGMGFKVSWADPGLYVRREADGSCTYVLMHVDDLLVAGKSLCEVGSVKAALREQFQIADLGEASHYLGMVIKRDRAQGTITLSQGTYSKQLLEQFGAAGVAPVSTPMVQGVSLVRAEMSGGEVMEPEFAGRYREIVGSLLYLSNCTRPDLAQAVGLLARFMSAPSCVHWGAAQRVLAYLAGTAEMGLVFGGSGFELTAYADADYAGDKTTRRSTTGYVFVLNGAAVSWQSKLQPTVALSTVEAEYMAAATAAREAIWLRRLLSDLGVVTEGATVVLGDNQGAQALVRNPLHSQQSKHIDVLYHFLRERCAMGELAVRFVATEQMVADVLTKPLAPQRFVECRGQMGVWAL